MGVSFETEHTQSGENYAHNSEEIMHEQKNAQLQQEQIADEIPQRISEVYTTENAKTQKGGNQ